MPKPTIKEMRPWEVLMRILPVTGDSLGDARASQAAEVVLAGSGWARGSELVIQGWFFHGAEVADAPDTYVELAVQGRVCARAALASTLLTAERRERIEELEARIAVLEAHALEEDEDESRFVPRFGTFPTPFLARERECVSVGLHGTCPPGLRAVLFGMSPVRGTD